MKKFSITCTANPEPVLALAGDLDLASADLLTGTAQHCLDDGARDLTIDFGGVTFMDSAGLNALVLIRRAADEAHVALHARRIPNAVARVLELTSLDSLFAADPGASGKDSSACVD